MDKALARTISTAAAEALQQVADEYGLALQVKGGNFTSTSAVLRFEFAEVQDGLAVTREAEAFKRYAPLHGIPADALGKIVELSDGQYRVMGWKPRSRKYPVLVQEIVTGKLAKIGAAYLRALLLETSVG